MKPASQYFSLCLPIEPASTTNILWVRFIIFTLIGWYILSHDYTVFADAPDSVLNIYPALAHGYLHNNYALTPPFLIDLVSFHWLHWVLPLPSAKMLTIIQITSALACFATAFLGRGPYSIFAATAVISFLYFHGFIWRSDALFDGFHLPLQIALLYWLIRPPEPGFFKSAKKQTKTEIQDICNTFMIAVLFAFVLYYFFSGFNKLVDVTLTDWFTFDLYQRTQDDVSLYLKSDYPGFTLPFVAQILFHPVTNLLVAVVYLSHLLTPLMLVNPRRYIPAFAVFYLIFHVMSAGMGVFFYSLIISWLVFLPVQRFTQSTKVMDAVTRIVKAPFIFAKTFLLNLKSPQTQVPKFLRSLNRTLQITKPSNIQTNFLMLTWIILGCVWFLIASWTKLHLILAPLTHEFWGYFFAFMHFYFAVVCFAIALVAPKIKNQWANGLYRAKFWAWAPLFMMAVAGNYFIQLEGLRDLLWGLVLLPALILWGPLGYKLIFKQKDWARFVTVVFAVLSLGIYTIPGVSLLPLSPGINGWTLQDATEDQDMWAWGLALVRDDGETAWLSNNLTKPNYYPERYFRGMIRDEKLHHVLPPPEKTEDIAAHKKTKWDNLTAWYKRRYERAWPYLQEGRFPHQKYLGNFALPTHNPAKNNPEYYLDFPPDRVVNIMPQLIIYDRKTAAIKEVHTYPSDYTPP